MKGAPLPPSGHAHLSRLSALERGYFRCEPPLPREDSPASLTSSTDHQPMLEHPKSRGAIGLKVPDDATGHMPQRALRHGPVPPEIRPSSVVQSLSRSWPMPLFSGFSDFELMG